MSSGRLGLLSLTRVFLVGSGLAAAGAAAGWLLFDYAPIAVLTALLKWSTGLIAVVWLFSLTVYNKLTDVTDLSGLGYRQHRDIELEVRARLQWFWLRAVFLVLLAIALNLPAILVEAKLTPSRAFVSIAFAALLVALFSMRGLWVELEEIRQLRSHVKELERMEKERAEQIKDLKDASKEEWTPDPLLDGFRGTPDLTSDRRVPRGSG